MEEFLVDGHILSPEEASTVASDTPIPSAPLTARPGVGAGAQESALPTAAIVAQARACPPPSVKLRGSAGIPSRVSDGLSRSSKVVADGCARGPGLGAMRAVLPHPPGRLGDDDDGGVPSPPVPPRRAISSGKVAAVSSRVAAAASRPVRSASPSNRKRGGGGGEPTPAPLQRQQQQCQQQPAPVSQGALREDGGTGGRRNHDLKEHNRMLELQVEESGRAREVLERALTEEQSRAAADRERMARLTERVQQLESSEARGDGSQNNNADGDSKLRTQLEAQKLQLKALQSNLQNSRNSASPHTHTAPQAHVLWEENASLKRDLQRSRGMLAKYTEELGDIMPDMEAMLSGWRQQKMLQQAGQRQDFQEATMQLGGGDPQHNSHDVEAHGQGYEVSLEECSSSPLPSVNFGEPGDESALLAYRPWLVKESGPPAAPAPVEVVLVRPVSTSRVKQVGPVAPRNNNHSPTRPGPLCGRGPTSRSSSAVLPGPGRVGGARPASPAYLTKRGPGSGSVGGTGVGAVPPRLLTGAPARPRSQGMFTPIRSNAQVTTSTGWSHSSNASAGRLSPPRRLSPPPAVVPAPVRQRSVPGRESFGSKKGVS